MGTAQNQIRYTFKAITMLVDKGIPFLRSVRILEVAGVGKT
jgi:hypothetical protein